MTGYERNEFCKTIIVSHHGITIQPNNQLQFFRIILCCRKQITNTFLLPFIQIRLYCWFLCVENSPDCFNSKIKCYICIVIGEFA